MPAAYATPSASWNGGDFEAAALSPRGHDVASLIEEMANTMDNDLNYFRVQYLSNYFSDLP